MDKFDRIFALHKQLARARVPMSRQRLQETLECSPATVKRIINQMRLYLGAPIEYDRMRNGYYYSRNPQGHAYELPGLWFSEQELYALLVCQQLLGNLQPGLLDEELSPLRERIDALLKTRHLSHGQLSRRIRVPGLGARQLSSEVFASVASALLQRKRLHFDYHGRASDRITHRIVSPQRLVHYRDNWYLDAWDHDRGALRTFAVERIRGVSASGEKAHDVPDSELHDLLAIAYGIFSGRPKDTAVLRFTAKAARWVADETWHPQQRSAWLPDGRYELRIPYSDPRELIMDILKYGEEVEVMSPSQLRSQIAATHAAAARQYDQAS